LGETRIEALTDWRITVAQPVLTADRRFDRHQLTVVFQGQQPHKFASIHHRQSGAAFPAHAFERLVQWVGGGDDATFAAYHFADARFATTFGQRLDEVIATDNVAANLLSVR